MPTEHQQEFHEPAENLFQDVNFIMVPTIPITYTTTRLLWKLYGEYIERQYVLLARNKYWTLYKRALSYNHYHPYYVATPALRQNSLHPSPYTNIKPLRKMHTLTA